MQQLDFDMKPGKTLELERPIVFFDLETTGTNPQQDRIVEFAGIKIWPDGKREELHYLVNPQVPIPKEASDVHGICDNDVKDKPVFAEAAQGEGGIFAFIRACDLAGYNILNFDLPLLLTEFGRAGVELDLTDVQTVDVYKIFVKREPRDLAGALRFYCGTDHREAHTALGDVAATIKVLEAQLKRYRDLPSKPQDLDARDPARVDPLGKLKRVDDEIVITFGKHKGKSLTELARSTPGYLRWLVENNVIPSAREIIREALDRQ